MKSIYSSLFLYCLSSCNPSPVKKVELIESDNFLIRSATIKELNINQHFHEKMTELERSLLLSNVIARLNITSANCHAGVVGTEISKREERISEGEINSSFNVQSGCDYTVSIDVLAKIQDGSPMVVLETKTKGVNLSKQELTKNSATVSLELVPTRAGEIYWKRSILSEDKDISIDARVELDKKKPSDTKLTRFKSFRILPCMLIDSKDLKLEYKCLIDQKTANSEDVEKLPADVASADFKSVFAEKIAEPNENLGNELGRCVNLSILRSKLARYKVTLCGINNEKCNTQNKLNLKLELDEDLTPAIEAKIASTKSLIPNCN